MKKLLIGFGVAVLLLGGIVNAGATLIDQGNGIIYDDAASQFWYQNMPDWTNQTYSEQSSGISQLNQSGSFSNLVGIADWRMAGSADMVNLRSYGRDVIGNMFSPTKTSMGNTFTTFYYSGRYDLSDGASKHDVFWFSRNSAWHYEGSYWVDDSAVGSSLGAWVVADASNGGNPVPEPASLILLGSGLAGLAFYRRKRK